MQWLHAQPVTSTDQEAPRRGRRVRAEIRDRDLELDQIHRAINGSWHISSYHGHFQRNPRRLKSLRAEGPKSAKARSAPALREFRADSELGGGLTHESPAIRELSACRR